MVSMHTDDRRQNVAEHPYDLPDVSRMITNGEDNARQALRGWVHQKCFSNVYQRERNAKIWFDGPSVVEAWHLWAHHQHLRSPQASASPRSARPHLGQG